MSALLGIRDEKFTESTPLSWDTNKIGGEPDWMYKGCELQLCAVCGNTMKLVVQVYCPLLGSPYHRTLYISTCCNKHCWNKPHSWIVQRSQILDQCGRSKGKTVVQVGIDVDTWGVEDNDWGDGATPGEVMNAEDWCDGADDWGDDCDAVTMLTNIKPDVEPNAGVADALRFKQMNLVAESCAADNDSVEANGNHSNNSQQTSNTIHVETEIINKDSVRRVMNILAVNSCNETTTNSRTSSLKSSQNPTAEISAAPIECFYMSVVAESEFKTENAQVDQLIKNYERETGTDLKMLIKSKNEMRGSDAEEYEKTVIRGDKFAHKFLKRLKLCPQQCIRYEWNSEPMYISQPSVEDTREITCSNCHGSCVFELQLMPPLVNFLINKDGQMSEFGTILIFTCKNSCWSSDQTILVESCLVQPDPDQHLFKD